MVEHHGGARHVIEQGLEALVEQRQPVFHAHVPAPRRDRLVERVVAARRAEQGAVAGAEPFDRPVVQEKLADRLQGEGLEALGRALGGGIEAADAVQIVTEKIEAQGLRLARRKDIDDAAAHGELAGLAHRPGAAVSVGQQEGHQIVGIETLSDGGGALGTGEDGARRDALQERRNRGQHDAPRARRRIVQKARQGIDAPPDDVGVGRHPVIGQTVPGGKQQGLDVGREKGQDLGGARGAHVVAGHEHGIGGGVARAMVGAAARARGRARHFGEHHGVMAAGGSGDQSSLLI